MSDSHVSVVLLSWNDADSLRGCLDSLQGCGYPHLSVLVVDNASSRYDARRLCEGRDLELIVNPENKGVAGGRNVGLARLLDAPRTRFILFLDDDTQVGPEMIERLVRAWNPDEGRAILGPAVYRLDSPGSLWSLGGRWHPGTGRTSRVAAPRRPGSRFEPVDFITGCAFFSHRRVFERVGLFDEAFNPYYGEDVDLCLRAARLGFRSACVTEASVLHRMSHAAGGRLYNAGYAYQKGEKTVMLMRRHANPAHWASFLMFEPVFLAGAAVREGSRGNIGAVSALVKGMLGGLRRAS